MSDHDRASQGRFARFCETAKAWLLPAQTPGRHLARLLSGRMAVSADELDDRLKRDIGFDGRARQDRRAEYYRKLVECGQPLP